MELWESTFLLFKPTVCSILYGSPRTLIHILSQNDILKWQFLYLWEERTLAFGEFGVSVLMTTRYMMWTLLGAHTLLLSWLFFFFFLQVVFTLIIIFISLPSFPQPHLHPFLYLILFPLTWVLNLLPLKPASSSSYSPQTPLLSWLHREDVNWTFIKSSPLTGGN